MLALRFRTLSQIEPARARRGRVTNIKDTEILQNVCFFGQGSKLDGSFDLQEFYDLRAQTYGTRRKSSHAKY
jgi:hypothetical protein